MAKGEFVDAAVAMSGISDFQTSPITRICIIPFDTMNKEVILSRRALSRFESRSFSYRQYCIEPLAGPVIPGMTVEESITTFAKELDGFHLNDLSELQKRLIPRCIFSHLSVKTVGLLFRGVYQKVKTHNTVQHIRLCDGSQMVRYGYPGILTKTELSIELRWLLPLLIDRHQDVFLIRNASLFY